MPTSTAFKRAAIAAGASLVLAPAAFVVSADASSSPTVKLKGMQFSPRSVTVKKGGKVDFVWAGGAHNLVGPGVKVGVQSKGSKVVTFRKAGTFKYVCQVHPHMTMVVKVK